MPQLAMFEKAVPRRWAIIAAAGVILGLSSLTRGAPSAELTGLFVVVAAGLNVVAWLTSRAITPRPWLAAVAFVLDLAIAAFAIGAVGSRGLVVGLLAVLVPYISHSSRSSSGMYIAATGAGYAAAVALHGHLVATPVVTWTDLPIEVWSEVGLLVVVAIAIRIGGARLNKRLRVIMSSVPGLSSDPVSAGPPDDIDALELTIRVLGDRVKSTMATLTSDAQTITEFAEVVRASAARAADANARLIQSSVVVNDGLEAQMRGAEAGERRSTTAIEYTRELGERVETVGNEVNVLLEHAVSARKQIHGSHEALDAIEHDVGGTLGAIELLKKTAATVNETLQAVLGVARQAHVLALNTAIKSANGEVSPQASTEIASRFRSLAADTSSSTRDAALLVDEMQQQIALAERAMRAGQTQARDAALHTETATRVLGELHLAALRSNELVSASIDVTRIQTEHLSELSKHLAATAASRAEASHEATSAAQAISLHESTMKELEAAGARLGAMADRLRHQSATLLTGGNANMSSNASGY